MKSTNTSEDDEKLIEENQEEQTKENQHQIEEELLVFHENIEASKNVIVPNYDLLDSEDNGEKDEAIDVNDVDVVVN